MAKTQNEPLETEQEKIDKKNLENLAIPTRALGLNILVNMGKKLNVDPKVLEILKKEENEK